jgi:hypothetical protein
MEREIVVRLVVPRWMKRRWTLAVVVLVSAVSAIVYATVPNTFAAGDQLSSSKLNANFTALDGRVAALEKFDIGTSRIVETRGGKAWSLGAVWCGVTASTKGSIPGGYAGAKGQCESACTSTSAHMCTTEEIVRTAQVGVAAPAGWYSAGLWSLYNGASSTVDNDCTAWTISTSAVQGYVWSSSYTSVQSCDTTSPILCCD